MIHLDHSQTPCQYDNDQANKNQSFQWNRCFKSLKSCESCCQYVFAAGFLLQASGFTWLLSTCYSQINNPELDDFNKRTFMVLGAANGIGILICMGKATEIIVKRCYKAVDAGRVKLI